MTAGLHRNGFLWMGALLIAGLATGCDPSASGKHDVRLIASSRPYEPDIPIPAGFRLMDIASEDRSTGVSRLYLRHLYTGKADKYAVRNFYREQMPLVRWTLVSAGTVRGVYSLRFEKGNESCDIEIRDAEQGLQRHVQVQVLVSQQQRGAGTADARAQGNRR
ncbi:MAG TPA: hypothetical protein VM243_13150 [Phycisphaerae bacterium]|nr:hypothetical protein [Phycisphaerae bacterium]